MFRDRLHAGRALAAAVGRLAVEDPVVLGLPRGGVPVAYEVARALGAPLDVLVARKIGAPGNPELAIGALAEGGVSFLDRGILTALLVAREELEQSMRRAAAEVHEHAARDRCALEPVPLEDRTVIVVDDGLATGATARAALRAVRAQGPRRLVLAVPVGSPACRRPPTCSRSPGRWTAWPSSRAAGSRHLHQHPQAEEGRSDAHRTQPMDGLPVRAGPAGRGV